MSDIHELAARIVAESPAHRALSNCDTVRRFIRHGQVDGKWGAPLDSALLLCVSQHSLPDGTPVYLAVLLAGPLFVYMLLAATPEGGYVKLPPDAAWGHAPTVE